MLKGLLIGAILALSFSISYYYLVVLPRIEFQRLEIERKTTEILQQKAKLEADELKRKNAEEGRRKKEEQQQKEIEQSKAMLEKTQIEAQKAQSENQIAEIELRKLEMDKERDLKLQNCLDTTVRNAESMRDRCRRNYGTETINYYLDRGFTAKQIAELASTCMNNSDDFEKKERDLCSRKFGK